MVRRVAIVPHRSRSFISQQTQSSSIVAQKSETDARTERQQEWRSWHYTCGYCCCRGQLTAAKKRVSIIYIWRPSDAFLEQGWDEASNEVFEKIVVRHTTRKHDGRHCLNRLFTGRRKSAA